ncbi:MAG: hypothetical protein Solivirus9_2 [Solivirus sp.]|uniref:Uncharacterized protein n=1 Tax=Solivirus sp. TaxID=2487772 RepID=A0A3G5AII9_9VIRU|nr:MAG: hypothetical protein Solivirus9_2 [Solivirus sp.]
MSSYKSISIRKDKWYKVDFQFIKEIKKKSTSCHIIFTNGYRPEIVGVKAHDPFCYCIKIRNPDDFKEEIRSDFVGILFNDAISESSRTSGPNSPSFFDNSVITDDLPVKTSS